MPYEAPITVRKTTPAEHIEALPINAAKRRAARAELERAEAAADQVCRAASCVRRILAALRRLLKVHEPRHGWPP